MRRLVAVATTIALAGITAPAADAAKRPTNTQRNAIAESAGIPAACLTIKSSTKRAGWASYTFRDRKSTRKQCATHASNGITIVQRRSTNGKRTWRQQWAGSDCPKRSPRNVPASVWRDLTGSYCR